MVSAVTAVFLLAYLDLRREQARALDDYSAEEEALARSVAETLGGQLDAVIRDLQAAADAANREQRNETFHRLLESDGSYREVELLDSSGKSLVELSARPQVRLSDSPVLKEARDQIGHLASGQMEISGPLRRSDQAVRERLRLFALRRADRIVVLLVDTDRFFRGMQTVVARATGAPVRWLVLDDERRWIEFSPGDDDSSVEWHTEDRPLNGEIAALLAAMGRGENAAVLLSRDAADSLGLGRRSAVAGFAPVAVRTTKRWSIAVVASAMRVRDRARMAAWRLGAATGLAGLLVALFGFIVRRQQLREHQLAEALHVAKATAALRERSEKMVEVIPIGVLALDSSLEVTSVNPYLVERGVTARGRLAKIIPRSTPDEVALLEALVLEARATRKPLERAGMRLHLGSDQARDVDVYAIPLGNPLPDTDCFLVLHDRTEMRVLERNLVRAEKLATIGTLAAGVAHEVGTPLGIISGRAEQLLSRLPDGPSGDAMRKSVSSILSQVDKVSTTIRQLLDFARVRPIEADAVTPAQALGHAAALLEHRFRHAKVELQVDAPATVASVAADPGQLEQVLVNLLMNACDACSSGGHVAVRATERAAEVAFDVVDDGAGIPPDHLSAVLDPFFTTKKRGQGTGLGLTIAADIVKNHGGSLTIDSTLGHGTTVRILLPKAKQPVAKSTTEGVRT